MTDKILLVENVYIKDNDFVLVKGKEYSFICNEEGLTIYDIVALMKRFKRLSKLSIRKDKRKPTKEEYKGFAYSGFFINYHQSSRLKKKLIGIEKKLNKVIKLYTHSTGLNREMIDLAYIETDKLRKLANRENFFEKFLN